MRVNKHYMYYVLYFWVVSAFINFTKVWQGVLHLVFFWTTIPTIISIIHGIIIIFTTKADQNGYIFIPNNRHPKI